MTDRTRPDHAALDRLRARMRASAAASAPPRPQDRAALPSHDEKWTRRREAAIRQAADARPAPEHVQAAARRADAAVAAVDACGVCEAHPVVPFASADDEPEREPMPDSAAVLRELREKRDRAAAAPSDDFTPDAARLQRVADKVTAAPAPDPEGDEPDTKPCLGGCGRVLPRTGMGTYVIEGALPYCADCFTRQMGASPTDGDEPDDGSPYRPRWPLLVSEDTKAALLDQLAEVVHAPTPPPGDPRAGDHWATFRRGVEFGMAKVMLALGINEAASPERASLPAPGATDQPADPAGSEPTLHAYHPIPGGIELLCDAPIYRPTRWTDDPDDVTCPACLTILQGAPE
jgi:hypothetical protein